MTQAMSSPVHLDLGESIIFSLLLLDSDRVSLGDTPISVNHGLNSTSILQHPALAARWWKHQLGGAGGRENVMVSGKSHTNPAMWLHFTTAFVVLCPQKETVGDAEQRKSWKLWCQVSLYRKSLVWKKWWSWVHVSQKQELFPFLYGAGVRPSLCLSFSAGSGLAEMVDQLLQLFPHLVSFSSVKHST